ncbi:vinculin-like isoform X2 [Asterias amurensis]|uniref:vinculin-like isoform X2 n=1 Tax=Asterias amurensis TaxID=7602 RepID=UPI003AB24716
MPTTSYRTKTIHSILDPVAQQVGQLVILHEQAEDGNAMSDLTSPIQIVAQAVSNLVAVGKQTASTSKDEILRREMPPTFQMVERSSGLLVDASHMLQADPYSVPARKKLIDGARGILQGTSDLLFVFDESEVRKIVKICEQVLQLLAVSEVVDTMADILTFVQSLTPGATSMNGQVSARREELINASHAAQLAQHTEQFQKLIPLLVSSMKIYVFIVQDNKPGKQEAWENRTYIASKMIYHIQEIIRVLLAVDDDSFRVDDVTGLRAAQNHIRNNMEKARGWLGDPNAAPGGMGEKALRRILEDARKVASGLDGPQRAAIEQAIDEITAMTNELADLRAKGQGNSPRALQLASAINGKLANLQAQIDAAIAEVLKSSMGKLAYTAGGKMAQAKEWLNNPGVDDRGVGYRAIKDIIETGRKIAATCDDLAQRNELLRLCNETEALAKQLKDLCDKGQGNTPQAEAAAKKLSEKLGKLKEKMTEIVMGQVSSDFLDPMAAVQKLQEAALAPEGTPNREGTFTSRAQIFLTNTNKAADTAARFADIADADKDTVDEINRLSNQVKELTPQVISAARIVLVNPGNKVAASHLDFMKKEWEGSMRELDAKLTSSLDVPAFMKASEESMKKQTEVAKAAVKQHDPQTFASSISNIALRGKNMVKVAKREADNSEDPEFKQKVDIASDKLTDCIPPTVLTGKQLMQDMGNPDKMANWQDANNKLMTSVAELKVPFIFVIPLQEYYPPPPPVPAPPPAQMGRAQPANQPMGGPYNGPGSVSSYTPRTHSSGGPDLPGYQRAAAELQEALHSPPVAPMAPYYPVTPAYSANRTDPLVHSASQQPYHAQPSGYQPVEAARTAPQVYAAPPAVPPVPQPPASYSPQVYIAPLVVSPVSQPPASYSSQVYTAPPVVSPVSQPQASYSLQTQDSAPLPPPPPPSYQPIEPRKADTRPISTAQMTQAHVLDPYVPSAYKATPTAGQGSRAANTAVGQQDWHTPAEMLDSAGNVRQAFVMSQPPVEDMSNLRVDHAPPRPPLPQGEIPPPRPPPPEEETEAHFPREPPPSNQPIMKAAYDLHLETQKWSSQGNDLIAAAKKMAILMAQMSKHVRGEGGSKKDFIMCARMIAKQSGEVVRLANMIADQCTDKRIRLNMKQVIERIPTFSTQLKILTTVKATMLGAQDEEKDEEATEMLIGNAQNLMQAVKETVRASEAASIKIRTDAGQKLRWVRRNPYAY